MNGKYKGGGGDGKTSDTEILTENNVKTGDTQLASKSDVSTGDGDVTNKGDENDASKNNPKTGDENNATKNDRDGSSKGEENVATNVDVATSVGGTAAKTASKSEITPGEEDIASRCITANTEDTTRAPINSENHTQATITNGQDTNES